MEKLWACVHFKCKQCSQRLSMGWEGRFGVPGVKQYEGFAAFYGCWRAAYRTSKAVAARRIISSSCGLTLHETARLSDEIVHNKLQQRHKAAAGIVVLALGPYQQQGMHQRLTTAIRFSP